MKQEKVKKQVESVLDESHIGIMATVKKNKPHSRYMTFFHRGLTLYTPTDKHAEKTEEIEENPYTHIIIGYEGEGFGDEYIEYEGKVGFHDSVEMKQALWNEDMKMYFTGPDDPNYSLLEIQPLAIRLMNKKGEPPADLEIE